MVPIDLVDANPICDGANRFSVNLMFWGHRVAFFQFMNVMNENVSNLTFLELFLFSHFLLFLHYVTKVLLIECNNLQLNRWVLWFHIARDILLLEINLDSLTFRTTRL